MDSLANFIPSVYLTSDTDGSLVAFIDVYDATHEEVVAATETLATVNQPRLAPVDFIQYIADHYGNPFPFMTNERWKDGNKIENLVYIYSLRGTKQGTQSAIRYLCGIEIDLLQDFEYSWELGVSMLPGDDGSTMGFGVAYGLHFGS